MMKRIVAMILWVVLGTSLATVAQVEGELALFSAENGVAFSVYQQAEAGAYVKTETGGQLSLTGLGEEVQVITTNPPSLLTYSLADFVNQWSGLLASAPAEENPYLTTAQINTYDGTLFVIINGVALVDNTVTLDVVLTQYIPNLAGTDFDINAAFDSKAQPPATFERAEIAISGNEALLGALQTTAQTDLGAVRADTTCTTVREKLAELTAESATAPSVDLLAQIRYVQAWLASNCE